ncbi:hypothetical protein SLE2022_277230 [Rubroshorea leprosula]
MASSDDLVRIVEVIEVAPSSNQFPTSAAEFTLPLTFFDTYWFKFSPVERLFFYPLPADSNPTFFNSEVLPKLKKSLSLTLLHFLPLAGNLIWPSPDAAKAVIRYTPNDAVSLTVAESDGDFNRLSGNEIINAIELHPLVPQLKASHDAVAITAIQITLFPNEGFCIGLTTHHTVLDGKSVMMFIKSWAYICTNQENYPLQLPSDLAPFFDRGVIKDPSGLDLFFLNQWLALTASDPKTRSLKVSQNLGRVSPNLIRATFLLSPDNINKLRELVLSKWNGKKPIHLSTFVLVVAYTATCLVKARGGESERTVLMGFIADRRTRLDPPVPENYFGNCVGPCGQFVKAGDLMDKNGLAFGANFLSDEIKGLEQGEVLEKAKNKWSALMDAFVKESGSMQMITVAGSPRFHVYGLNFGWGKPRKVEIVSVDRTGAISLAESGDGSGGVEIGLALEKHETEIVASLFKF